MKTFSSSSLALVLCVCVVLCSTSVRAGVPTVALSSSYTVDSGAASVVVDLVFSEDVSGLAIDDLEVTGGEPSNLQSTSASVYTVDVARTVYQQVVSVQLLAGTVTSVSTSDANLASDEFIFRHTTTAFDTAQCGSVTTPLETCQEVSACGASSSGVHRLADGGNYNQDVFCEQERDGGGWMSLWEQFGGAEAATITHESNTELFAAQSNDVVTPSWHEGHTFNSNIAWSLFSYYGDLPNMVWGKFGAVYNGAVHQTAMDQEIRMYMGNARFLSMARLRAGDPTAAAQSCYDFGDQVELYVGSTFIGRTNYSFTNGDFYGLANAEAAQDRTCGQPASNLIDALGSNLFRLDSQTVNNGMNTLFGYRQSISGSDSNRCWYCCWGCPGYTDTFVWAARKDEPIKVNLRTAATDVTSPFTVDLFTSEACTISDLSSITVDGGVASALSGSQNAYSFTVTPNADVLYVTVQADAGLCTNAAGASEASNYALVGDFCDVASLGNTTDNSLVLDSAASGIYNDEVKVVFTESVKYSNTQFAFGSSSCATNHFTWQSVTNSPTCERTWTGTASWADFTANCDLIRTESAIESVDHIIYQASFAVTHTEQLDPLRPGDDPITRTITDQLPFEVRLPTSVTATTSPVRIFAPVVVEAAILEQGVSGTPGGDMTGRVGFLTSVQYPFRLGSVTGVTTPAGVATSDADPSVWVGHGEVGTCNDDSAAPCTQFFEWSFSPASGAICELDGEYNVTLEVECQASQVNDCPLDPNPGSVTLSFTLDTTDFCVELVDDLSVSASLETYLSDDFLVVKHDFIDGQRIYAQAPTQAEVSLSATKVVQVSLVKPDASEIFFLNQGSPALTTEGTQVDLVTVDGGAVGPAQNSLPSFNFLADSELFGIAADQSDFITLKARIELTYDNAGQAKRTSRDLEWTVQATTSSGTVATSFAMSGSNAVATQGTGTSASTSPAAAATVAGVNVLFMGAALVVMCTVLIAAVVISRGRAKIDALREQLATKAQA